MHNKVKLVKVSRAILFFLIPLILCFFTVPICAKTIEPLLFYEEENIIGTVVPDEEKTHGPYEMVLSLSVKITDIQIFGSPPYDKRLHVYIVRISDDKILWNGPLGEGQSSPWIDCNSEDVKVVIHNKYYTDDQDYRYTGKVRWYHN